MRFIVVLLLLVLAVVFAVQNATMVTLTAFFWQLDASLAVIIVLCFAVGAIVATLALLPSLYRHRTEHRRLQSRLATLERTNASTTAPTTTTESHTDYSTSGGTPVVR